MSTPDDLRAEIARLKTMAAQTGQTDDAEIIDVITHYERRLAALEE